MAKRGETRPWRVSYTFDNAVAGTLTFRTEEEALRAALRQALVVGPRGERCDVTVKLRPTD